MGLFDRYRVSPAQVYDAAAAIESAVAPVGAARGQILSRHAHAVAATSGSIEPPLSAADQQVVSTAEGVLQKASFAGGATRYWGDAITTYNFGVDDLNERYESAEAANFGQTAPRLLDYFADGRLGEYLGDLGDYQSRVATARADLVRVLKNEEQALMDTLDGEAAKVSSWLAAGPDDAAVLALIRAGAMPLGVVDIFPGIVFSSLDMAALQRRLAALGRQDFLDPSQFPTAESVQKLLDLLREDGVPPTDYGPMLERYWLLVACEKAGIYLDGWDPSAGAEANLPNLIASYDYYAKLFLDSPDFQWAGMASMIGPTFAGGMFDLHMLRRLADLASGPLDDAPDWLVNPLLPTPLRELSILGEMTEQEFAFFETSLLGMQKAIFSDQMPMHETYLANGLGGIEELYDAGLIDAATLNAWRDIDSGDASRVAAGNEQLLYREQHDIIGQAYDDMRNYHGPVGQTMTYVMGAIGSPGIPGAQTLGQYDPLTFGGRVQAPGLDSGPVDLPFTDIDLPGVSTPRPYGQLDVTTPLPAGNISNFDTRWDLIEHDTLPAYQKLLAENPDLVEEILTAPVGERIDDARLGNNIDDILARLTDWEVQVEVGVE